MKIVLLFICMVGIASGDIVVLQDGVGSHVGTIMASDESSLRLETQSGERMTLPWDIIKSVTFDDATLEPSSMKDRLERADRIWRARKRLQRGDAALAEPEFERLFDPSPARRGETDLIIAEGLLRCRLNRGALAEAIVPALETARLRSLKLETNRFDELAPIHDAESELCLYLPPAWPEDQSVARQIKQVAQWESGGNDDLSAMADRYLRLLELHEQNLTGEMPQGDLLDSSHPGVGLLDLAIESRSDDPATRRSARNKLDQRLASRESWEDPWLRYMLGVSMLHESGDGMRRQGLVQLAWIPASHAQKHPYLAGLSLALMASELSRRGEHDAASRLEAELKNYYPNHPAISSRNAVDNSSTQKR